MARSKRRSHHETGVDSTNVEPVRRYLTVAFTGYHNEVAVWQEKRPKGS